VSGSLKLHEDGKQFQIVPVGTGASRMKRMLKSLIAYTYEIIGPDNKLISIVKYRPLKDVIVIEEDYEKIEIKIRLTRPMKIAYKGKDYEIQTKKIRGDITITCKGKVVTEGRYGVSFVRFTKYEESIKDLLKGISVGLGIRLLDFAGLLGVGAAGLVPIP